MAKVTVSQFVSFQIEDAGIEIDEERIVIDSKYRNEIKDQIREYAYDLFTEYSDGPLISDCDYGILID